MERAFENAALRTIDWNFEALMPAADVVETAEAITVRMDLPGHEPNLF